MKIIINLLLSLNKWQLVGHQNLRQQQKKQKDCKLLSRTKSRYNPFQKITNSKIEICK